MLQSMLLTKVEVFFRKMRFSLYLTKKGKNLSQDKIYLVKAFYEDNEFSQQMPRKNDVYSTIHKQEQLILLNLNEIYANFKSKDVSTSTGFSKFCELWPKWCLLPGSSGIHSVCIVSST